MRVHQVCSSKTALIQNDRWLYSGYFMRDANFKLKQKEKRVKHDPDLTSGLAYFVEDAKYKEHLKANKDEKEVRVDS